MSSVSSVWHCRGQLSQAAGIPCTIDPFAKSDTYRSHHAIAVADFRQIPSENVNLCNQTERAERAKSARKKSIVRGDRKSHVFRTRNYVNHRSAKPHCGRKLSLQCASGHLPLAVQPLPSDKLSGRDLTEQFDKSAPDTTTLPEGVPREDFHQALVNGTADTSTNPAQPVDLPPKVRSFPSRTNKKAETIQVSREKWIPSSKVDLKLGLRGLFEEGEEWMNEEEFWTVCTYAEAIIHAEHKLILEELRVDYSKTHARFPANPLPPPPPPSLPLALLTTLGTAGSLLRGSATWLFQSLPRIVQPMAGNGPAGQEGAENLSQLASNLFSGRGGKEGEGEDQGMSGFLEKAMEGLPGALEDGGDGGGGGAEGGGGGEGALLLVAEGQTLLASLGSGRLGGLGEGRGDGEGWEEEARKRVEVERKEIETATARFESNFLLLLLSAQFEGLSARDLHLTAALNSDYLLTLPIDVDWEKAANTNAVIFRRGYTTEREEGLMFGPKFDFIQSAALEGLLRQATGTLAQPGSWSSKKWRALAENRPWVEKVRRWLFEPLRAGRGAGGLDKEVDSEGAGADIPSGGATEGGGGDARTRTARRWQRGRGGLRARKGLPGGGLEALPIWGAGRRAIPRYEAVLSKGGSRGMILRRFLGFLGFLPPVPGDMRGAAKRGVGARGGGGEDGEDEQEEYLRPRYVDRISMRHIWQPASEEGEKKANVVEWLRAAINFFGSRIELEEVAFEEIVLLYTKGRGDEEGEDGCLQMQAYTKIPIPDLKLLVNRTLYEKSLASGFGTVHFIVDASEEQQGLGELDEICEKFIFSTFGQQVDFPVTDAVETLLRFGLAKMATELTNEEQLTGALPRGTIHKTTCGINSAQGGTQVREELDVACEDKYLTNIVASMGQGEAQKRGDGSLRETVLIGAVEPIINEVQPPRGVSSESRFDGGGTQASASFAEEERRREAALVGDGWEMEGEEDWESKTVVAVGMEEGKRVLERKWASLLKQGSPWALKEGFGKE